MSRICILSWKDPRSTSAGGAERYLVEVASRWCERGHRVTFIGPTCAPGSATDVHSSVAYVALGPPRTVFRRGRAFLRRHRADFDCVLESVSTRPFRAHCLVGRRALALYHQAAVEVWAREFPPPLSWAGRYIIEPHWIRSMRTARVVAVSQSTAASLAQFGLDVERIIPPGCTRVRLSDPGRRDSDQPSLLWIGRLARTKCPGDAVEAFLAIKRSFPRATLDIVGTGYLEPHFRRLAVGGMTVHGFVSEAHKSSLLRRADLLLLPGTREGWGIVALEASSNGVPVVAYDIPGLRDAVAHDRTGVLVSPNPMEMAGAAIGILSDTHRWRRYAAGGLHWARHFTWERSAEQLLTVLLAGVPVPPQQPSDAKARATPTLTGEAEQSASPTQWPGSQ